MDCSEEFEKITGIWLGKRLDKKYTSVQFLIDTGDEGGDDGMSALRAEGWLKEKGIQPFNIDWKKLNVKVR